MKNGTNISTDGSMGIPKALKYGNPQRLAPIRWREKKSEMISYCQDAGTGLIPWSPLARGVLSRPRHGNVSSNVPDRSIRESTAQMINILDRVEEIAKRKGINMAQTATAWAWVLSHPGANPIMGLNSKKRIDETVASIQVAKGVTKIER
ncbi:NADP-dependent oxidoreductase domain containing protein [Elaphomyces granulatus]